MNFYKNIVLPALLCFVAGNKAMKNNIMVEIKSEKDLGVFDKKVVAYTTESSDLGKEVGYILQNNPAIKYAYIENADYQDQRLQKYLGPHSKWGFLFEQSNPVFLYTLSQLSDIKGARWCYRCVKDEILRDASLKVRNINQQEAGDILDAIQNEKAEFAGKGKKGKSSDCFELILEILRFEKYKKDCISEEKGCVFESEDEESSDERNNRGRLNEIFKAWNGEK